MNLRVIEVALSDAEGKLNLARDWVGDGAASLEASRHRAGQDTLEVPVTRLDALSDDLSANLKFIKCDVEEHERSVFRGGEQMLRRHRPVVQFESTAGGEQTLQIFQFFRDLGYSGVLLLGDRYLPHANPDNVRTTSSGSAAIATICSFRRRRSAPRSRTALASQFPAEAMKF